MSGADTDGTGASEGPCPWPARREIKINPKIRDLIPPLRADELMRLEENMMEFGCLSPLLVWEETGELLDGHNRFEILTRRGWAYSTLELSFENEAEACEWVLRNQLGRRNLTDAQRAELVRKLKPSITAQAKANEKAGGGDKKSGAMKSSHPIAGKKTRKPTTRAQLAKLAGVSEQTFANADTVFEHGDEETKQAMRNGAMSINAAAKKVKQTRAAKGETKPPAKRKPRPEPDSGADNANTAAQDALNARLEQCVSEIRALAAEKELRGILLNILVVIVTELST